MSSVHLGHQWNRVLAPLSFSRRVHPRSFSSTARKVPSIYVAATQQHAGKTAVSLALMSGLKKRFEHVGFLKPVGEESRLVNDPITGKMQTIDKDAALMHLYFDLNPRRVPLDAISPVQVPAGYTRDYLDGKISGEQQKGRLLDAYRRIAQHNDVVLCEGTGHCAVGAIVDASNAQVAEWLDQTPVVLTVNGGLGRSLDAIVLNQTHCAQYNVPIAGVIVNQVTPGKYEQTAEYMTKALQHKFHGEIPLLGCIPDRPFLGCPALSDLKRLLDGQLVSGQEHSLRHYRVQNDLHLVACSLEAFLQRLRHARAAANQTPPSSQPHINDNRTLYVCHASRTDILLGFLMEAVQHNILPDDDESNCESSMLITGCSEHPLSAQVLEIVAALPNSPPVLMTPHSTDETLKRMYAYTPKLNQEDPRRVATAIEHYEPYIDFELLMERIGCSAPRAVKGSGT